MVPAQIQQFSGQNDMYTAIEVQAGATSSFVLNKSRHLFLFGKFKNSGDGSGGQPWVILSSSLFFSPLSIFKFRSFISKF